MKDLIKLQVIHIATKNGKLVATLSYQDLAVPMDLDDANDGYRTIEVPVNLRDLNLSSKENQSSKEDHTILAQHLGEGQLSSAFLKSINSIKI
jgi:hypothetical protein